MRRNETLIVPPWRQAPITSGADTLPACDCSPAVQPFGSHPLHSTRHERPRNPTPILARHLSLPQTHTARHVATSAAPGKYL